MRETSVNAQPYNHLLGSITRYAIFFHPTGLRCAFDWLDWRGGGSSLRSAFSASERLLHRRRSWHIDWFRHHQRHRDFGWRCSSLVGAEVHVSRLVAAGEQIFCRSHTFDRPVHRFGYRYFSRIRCRNLFCFQKEEPCCLTSRRSQPPLALSVPLSRFTSRVGGGSAFFVRRKHP